VTDATFGRTIRRLLAAHGSVSIQMPLQDPESPPEESALVVVGFEDTEGGSAFYAEHEDDALKDAERATRGS